LDFEGIRAEPAQVQGGNAPPAQAPAPAQPAEAPPPAPPAPAPTANPPAVPAQDPHQRLEQLIQVYMAEEGITREQATERVRELLRAAREAPNPDPFGANAEGRTDFLGRNNPRRKR
jgi:hypothetical protein